MIVHGILGRFGRGGFNFGFGEGHFGVLGIGTGPKPGLFCSVGQAIMAKLITVKPLIVNPYNKGLAGFAV
jgi:hypothetical protein